MISPAAVVKAPCSFRPQALSDRILQIEVDFLTLTGKSKEAAGAYHIQRPGHHSG